MKLVQEACNAQGLHMRARNPCASGPDDLLLADKVQAVPRLVMTEKALY
jgi:hypothetical protein